MTDALRISQEIRCTPEHAFAVWTTRLSTWWPTGHSASGDPDTVVTLEPRLGGRIYERTPDGTEFDWGEVIEWSPPHRLAYRWHIAWDVERATDVLLTFVDLGNDRTRLDIVHSGWERFGEESETWRTANSGGWSALLPTFVAAAEA
jgi:uncharacterized protein YndB with AHSA1/START domain